MNALMTGESTSKTNAIPQFGKSEDGSGVSFTSVADATIAATFNNDRIAKYESIEENFSQTGVMLHPVPLRLMVPHPIKVADLMKKWRTVGGDFPYADLIDIKRVALYHTVYPADIEFQGINGEPIDTYQMFRKWMIGRTWTFEGLKFHAAGSAKPAEWKTAYKGTVKWEPKFLKDNFIAAKIY